MNNVELIEAELKNLSYQAQCTLLNNNPVLIARHFHYKVKIYFIEIVLDRSLRKTKYFALPIEFQEWGSQH